MFNSLSQKQKIIFIILICLMCLFILYFFYTLFYQKQPFLSQKEDTFLIENLIETPSSDESEVAFEKIKEDEIIVYICGAVKESKVISLKEKSRIADAIEAVGGLTDTADLTNVNLAYILEDGEKIYIPKKGEILENQTIISNSRSSSNSQSSIPKGKINLNKAGQAELEGIPGIGPSTALKIIQYRNENGKFSSIEDIKNVSGIGDGKFEKMKDYITTK